MMSPAKLPNAQRGSLKKDAVIRAGRLPLPERFSENARRAAIVVARPGGGVMMQGAGS